MDNPPLKSVRVILTKKIRRNDNDDLHSELHYIMHYVDDEMSPHWRGVVLYEFEQSVYWTHQDSTNTQLEKWLCDIQGYKLNE